MGRNITMTLGFNLVSEIEEATRSLYELNDKNDFTHIIVDLGFPLEYGADIPDSIEDAKLSNTKALIELCEKYGSKYIQLPNIGVSQNWSAVAKYVDLQNDDVLICADPDERTESKGWVKAIANVLRSENKFAWCSLMMKEHIPLMNENYGTLTNIGGERAYWMKGGLNWAQGGFSGKFLNEIGGVPVPDGAPIYGWLEHACMKEMDRLGWHWAILAEHTVEHTECSPIYREWKSHITSNVKQGQISFEDWLIKQKV